MKVLADKLTGFIVRTGSVREEAYEAYSYCIQITLEMSVCFIVGMGTAVCLHMLSEFIVFMVVFMLLRTYVGGVHLNSFLACFICSLVVQTIVLVANHLYEFTLIISWGIIFVSGILILWLTPVENINKKLSREEKEHCRRVTMKILIGIAVLSIYFTIADIKRTVSLIAMTVLVVFISQCVGIIKYMLERKSERQGK